MPVSLFSAAIWRPIAHALALCSGVWLPDVPAKSEKISRGLSRVLCSVLYRAGHLAYPTQLDRASNASLCSALAARLRDTQTSGAWLDISRLITDMLSSTEILRQRVLVSEMHERYLTHTRRQIRAAKVSLSSCISKKRHGDRNPDRS